MTNPFALPPGTELIGEFRIERVLGAGGFGMTYLAVETALARLVTIKEYFPTDFAARVEGGLAQPRDADSEADFKWGLDRFIDEAQALAKFDHPNIVRVFRYFQANGTAYMVLTFEEGQSLKGWLRALGRAPRQRELDEVIPPLLDALETIHAADFLHRDIAPDNIIIRKDGTPVLIDFGSARGDIAGHTKTVSALVKPGYSPYEQYAESGARQGPWTDIYAFAATLYHAVCGRRPPDAPSRVVRDELRSVRDAALATYRSRFLDGIDRALRLDPGQRPQSIAAWRGDLMAPDPVKPGWLKRATGLAPKPAATEAAASVKTRVLTQQPGSPPPPPDAPAPPGRLLDYIEGLQPKPADPPAPVEHSSAPQAAGTESPSRRKAGERRPTASRGTAPEVTRDAALAHVPVKSKPPRPRAMPGERKGRWRNFAAKFAVGAAVAAGVIVWHEQGRLPSDEPVKRAATARVSEKQMPRPELALEQSARLTSLPGHRGGTTNVAFTDDGRSLVTSGADGTLKIWNAGSGREIRSITLDAGAATATAIEGSRALTGHADGRVGLWDLQTGSRLGTFKRADAAIMAVALATDSNRLLAASRDSMVSIWDPSVPQQPAGLIEAHEGPVTAIAHSSRNGFLATGGDDHTVRLWRVGRLELVRSYRGHRAPITSLAFSPDGRYVAAAAADGRIRIWSTSSSSLYRLMAAHKAGVRGLAFSPSGEILASAADDGSVQLWQVRQSRTVRASSDHGPAARALAFAPDGSRAAVASADGSVRFWDAASPSRRP